MAVQAGSEVHFSKHLLPSSRPWEPGGHKGKRTCKKQTGKANQLETVPKSASSWDSHSENVPTQDQAFERIQKTMEAQGLSMPRNSWSCRARHINFGFKGEAAINPRKAPRGSSQATAAQHCRAKRQDVRMECLPWEVNHPGRYTSGHSFQRTSGGLWGRDQSYAHVRFP